MSLETSRRSQQYAVSVPPPPPTYVLRTRSYRRAASLWALAALIALAGLIFAGTAEAQTATKLVGNSAQSSSASVPFSNTIRPFQAFTTGSHQHGYILTRLDLEIRSSATNPNYSITINEVDDSGNPGVGTALTNPESLTSSFALTQFTAPSAPASGITLFPNTTYFVTFTGDSAVQVRLTGSGDEDAAQAGWSIYDGYRSGPNFDADNSVKMDLYGHELVAPTRVGAPNPDPAVLSNTEIDAHGNRPRALSFTVGPQDVTLKEVRTRVEFGLLSHMSVQIWRDGQGNPGAFHCNMGTSDTRPNPWQGPKTFGATFCTLNANTTYWVVVNHHSTSDAGSIDRRNYKFGEGSTSSYGWSFGESRYLHGDGGGWGTDGRAPWLELVPTSLPSTVTPPPPPPPPAVDTRSAACQARQAAAEKEFPYATVIVHCE